MTYVAPLRSGYINIKDGSRLQSGRSGTFHSAYTIDGDSLDDNSYFDFSATNINMGYLTNRYNALSLRCLSTDGETMSIINKNDRL